MRRKEQNMSLPFSSGKRPLRDRLFTQRTFAILTLLIFLAGLQAASAGPAAPALAGESFADTEERCLVDDPFNLDDFTALIGSDDPPREPQTIAPGLVVQLLPEKGTLIDPPDDLPPPSDDPGGEPDPDPEEPPVDDTFFRQVEFIVFNSRTENQFLVTMDQDMLNEIRQCHEEKGWTSATEGFDTPEDPDPISSLFLPLINRIGPASAADLLIKPAATAEPCCLS
jgi:hypothetical protein